MRAWRRLFLPVPRRESRSTTMTPVGRVGVACDVQSGVENALPRRCTVAPLLARVFHAAGAVHRLLGFRSIPAFRRSTVGGRGAAAGPGARPRGAGAAGDFRRDRSVWQLGTSNSSMFGVNYFSALIVLAGSARRGSRINNRDRERSRRNGGTTSAESRVGHAATCSVAGRVRPAAGRQRLHQVPAHA